MPVSAAWGFGGGGDSCSIFWSGTFGSCISSPEKEKLKADMLMICCIGVEDVEEVLMCINARQFLLENAKS